jgi:hypothetical protein
LQDVVRSVLDRVSDGVAVRGSQRKRPEDEQVKRALQHFALDG